MTVTGDIATIAAQTAVIAVLKADGTLSGLVGSRIYDVVAPQGVTAPYVVVSGTEETPDDRFNTRGRAVELQIKVVDDITQTASGTRRGKLSAMTAAKQIAVLLDDISHTVTGYDNWWTQHTRTLAYDEPDPATGRVYVHVALDVTMYLTES